MLNQSVIGPYDTVTLKASDPNALDNWLTVNGYTIPANIQPTIAAYVAGGFDFIALRLAPGEGVQSMQPVRVVTQGADPTLPLRMVAAGVGATVGITLYVISEGRYEAQSPFFNDVIPTSQLVWLHAENRSNYQDLSQQIMQSHGGRTWLTEYAEPSSLAQTQNSNPPYCGVGPSGPTPSFYGGAVGIADYYLGQCTCGVRPTLRCCSSTSAIDPGDGAIDPGDGAIDDADANGAGDSASHDAASVPLEASVPYDAASEASVAGDSGGNPDPCADFDDLEVALVGGSIPSEHVDHANASDPRGRDPVRRRSAPSGFVASDGNLEPVPGPRLRRPDLHAVPQHGRVQRHRRASWVDRGVVRGRPVRLCGRRVRPSPASLRAVLSRLVTRWRDALARGRRGASRSGATC